MSYVEALASEYHMTLEHIFHRMPLATGLAMLDARSSRLGLMSIGYIERAIIQARVKCRRFIADHFTIQ
jgi:hypothetical protein